VIPPSHLSWHIIARVPSFVDVVVGSKHASAEVKERRFITILLPRPETRVPNCGIITALSPVSYEAMLPSSPIILVETWLVYAQAIF